METLNQFIYFCTLKGWEHPTAGLYLMLSEVIIMPRAWVLKTNKTECFADQCEF